jgi:dihydrofolate reductase
VRKIIASLFISLDGVVESPDKWSLDYWTDEIGEVIGDAMANSDAMLLGRKTYQGFAAVWPTVTIEQDPGADYMNNTRKYVVSNTLTSADWHNSTLLSGDLATEINKIKSENGGDIMTSGSATLVRSLLTHNVVDELNLLLYPVVVGRGQRLFDDNGAGRKMTLLRSNTFDNGVLNLVYTPAAGLG